LLGDIIERFETNSIGKRSIAGKSDHILFGAGQIAGYRHAESRGERGAGVPRAIAVVVTLGAQGKAIQSTRLTHGVETSAATGEQLVDVGLVAYIKNKPVRGRVEDVVHGQGQLYDAEVGPQMAAGL
jgi:hypothetical protein